MQVSFTNLCLFSIFALYLICISDITHYVTKYHSKSLFNDHWIFLVKKFHGTFSRVPWNFLNNIWTTSVVPWNSMEFHGILSRSKVPWNSMELFPHSRVPWNSMEFHGTFNFPPKSSMEFHGIPWNFFWSSMEFHGIPWNLIKFIFKKIIFLNIVFGIWLMIRCYLAKISQKRYKLHWFQYRNSYFEHPSVSENGTRSAKMACCSMYSALGIMRFSDVNVYLISKFMFRVCKGDVPEIFRAYFRFNSEIHNYFTRQCDYLHVPIVKSNLGKSNIRYRGVIIWNYIISKGVDLDISEAIFVKMVKRIVANGMLRL